MPAAANQGGDPGPEHPQWEPDDDTFIDLNDLSPEDPLWADFYTTPFAPFPDRVGAGQQ
jgi:hypothetical protein